MLRAAIIEDEEHQRETLLMLLAEHCPEIQVAGTAATLAESLVLLRDCEPDILFLDVELKGGTAFDLLQRARSVPPAIIFTTAFDHYALQAIKFSALDYLLKPIIAHELVEAVAKAKKTPPLEFAVLQKLTETAASWRGKGKQRNGLDVLALPTFEGLEFVTLKDIVRMEAHGSYTNVYTTAGEKIIVSKILQQYEELLAAEYFYRVHKSHLVNLRHVKKYIDGKGGFVVTSDGATIDVAARKKKEFLAQLRKA